MENSGKSALGLDANVAAGLAYIPICAIGIIMSIIILVTDKTNKLARFHAFQSLLLCALWIVLYIVVIVIVGVAAAANSGIMTMLASLLWFVVIIGFLIAVIICCIQAFMGKMFKLPIIGDMADKWSN
ncbi:MAG TPA: hypothetical protein VGO43_13325 [Pyrinomonadaceae bacterium]|jgi:uncharacterized membrane protein|nr:hypothetical protein [Pyrinomonadaceae bacterium]